ncbi:hypothetical protein HCQ94_02620 [Actinomyces sp. zg-332]|uniref:hypothetical protein n=1 Tax=Actinomyces sp. zg-332 TaxID=2708340 RepID=UPI0014220A6E|nr:hypothetical protein [Actinomyces sp. zg-332]QPK94610.1 hypothetical protein HCQ94_02620 [Actinomyces sp. zg-332]
MSIENKDCCVLVTSSSLEHNNFYKILKAFYELYDLKVQFKTLTLDEEFEYKSDDFYKQVLDNIEPTCKALHIDSCLADKFINCVDFADDSVKLTRNANLIINTSGMKTAFNTSIYGLSTAIDRTCEENNRITSFDKAVIMGNSACISSAIVSCAEKQIGSIYLLSENYAGKNNPYAIANRNGIAVEPLPYIAPNIVKDFLNEADLIISYLKNDENTYWKKHYSSKKNSVAVQIRTDTYPSEFIVKSMQDGSKVVSPFTILFYQTLMSLKVIFGDIFEDDINVVKKKVFELAFR